MTALEQLMESVLDEVGPRAATVMDRGIKKLNKKVGKTILKGVKFVRGKKKRG